MLNFPLCKRGTEGDLKTLGSLPLLNPPLPPFAPKGCKNLYEAKWGKNSYPGRLLGSNFYCSYLRSKFVQHAIHILVAIGTAKGFCQLNRFIDNHAVRHLGVAG